MVSRKYWGMCWSTNFLIFKSHDAVLGPLCQSENIFATLEPWCWSGILAVVLGALLLSLVSSFSSSSCSSFRFFFLSQLFFLSFFLHPITFSNGYFFILFRLVCIKKSLLLFIQMWLFLFSFLYSMLWCHWQCMIFIKRLKYSLHSFVLDLLRWNHSINYKNNIHH